MDTCLSPLPEGCTLAGRGQSGSRILVKGGSQARRMAPPRSSGTVHLALFREGQSRYFCHTEKHKLSPVVFNRGPQRALGVDALTKKWPPVLLYAFPPFPLLPAVLAKVIILKAKVLLLAPDWPQKTSMPDLIALLRESPWRLPVRQDMLSQAQVSHPNPGKYRLHAWPLDGSQPEIL